MPARSHLTTDDIGVSIGKALSNKVVINQLSDFPTASGGKITLAANTVYCITGSINIGTDYLELGDNTKLEGISALISQIIYTGTGGALRGTDVSVSIEGLTIASVTAGGLCWNFVNAAKTKTAFINECIISSQNSKGIIDGYNIQYISTCNFVNTSNGIELKNGNYLYVISAGFDSTNTGTFITIPSGSYIGGQIVDCTFNVAATHTAINLNSATTTFSGICLIQGNIFTGAGTYRTGHNVATYYDVEYKGNSGVPNTVARGSLYWVDNAGTMTLASSEGYKKITGGTSLAGALSRFSHTSPNRLTYLGKRPITVKINLSVTADYETGGAFVSAIALGKNGTVDDASQSGFTIYSAEEPCSTDIITIMNQNDYIESFIKKFSGASTTIKVGFLNIQINELS